MTAKELQDFLMTYKLQKPYLDKNDNYTMDGKNFIDWYINESGYVVKKLNIDDVTNRFLAIENYPNMKHSKNDIIKLPSEEWKYADGTHCDAQYFLDYPDYFKEI